MPDFSANSWDSFKEQLMSVIRFIFYCFDMFFDTCRSNPMLYAFLFFPVFALAFLLIFEMLMHLTPLKAVINQNKVKGVLSSSKLSAKSYGKSLGNVTAKQIAASKKAAADAKARASLINRINGSSGNLKNDISSGNSNGKIKVSSNNVDIASGKPGTVSINGRAGSGSIDGSITSRGEGKAVHGSKRIKNVNDSIRKRRADREARIAQDEAIYEQIEAEQNKYRLQHEEDERKFAEEYGRKFGTVNHISYEDDGNGNLVTVRRKEVHGELESESRTVYHKRD